MERQKISFNGHTYKITIRDVADKSVAAEIFKLREYRIAEEVIKSATNSILDIGAHSGLFTIYARALNPDVFIVAVEPESANLALLKEHIKENGLANIKIIAGAIARAAGRRQLIISADSHSHALVEEKKKSKLTTATVQAQPLGNLLASFQPAFVPSSSRGETGPPLAEKISRVDLVKMDIEGGEYEVIEGLGPEDYKKIGAIIMEYHNYNRRNYQEIEERLRENGFGVQVFPSKFDKKMGFLFAKNKRN